MSSLALTYAQKSNVSKASGLLIVEPVNYDEARALINEAKVNDETKDDPKTWYTAGRIGYQAAYSQRNNWYIGQAIDAGVASYGLKEMYDNYVEADKRDGQPDKKGKIKYKQRKKIIADFKDLHEFYTIVGSTQYQQADFNGAYEMFLLYSDICDLPMFADEKIKVDSLYNQSLYFAALSAIQAKQGDKAILVLKRVLATDYKENIGAYSLLANEYLAKADTAKYIETINEAIARYPESAELVGTMVNFYVGSGEYEKAIDYLDDLIAKDPNQLEYQSVKAELLTAQNKFDESNAIIDKVLANNPGNTRFTFLKGRALAFEGDHVQDAAQDLKDNKAYNEAITKAKGLYGEAIGYFEKAKAGMTKEDSSYYDLLQNMKVLYLRLENTAKYKEIDDEMKSL